MIAMILTRSGCTVCRKKPQPYLKNPVTGDTGFKIAESGRSAGPG